MSEYEYDIDIINLDDDSSALNGVQRISTNSYNRTLGPGQTYRVDVYNVKNNVASEKASETFTMSKYLILFARKAGPDTSKASKYSYFHCNIVFMNSLCRFDEHSIVNRIE